MKVLTFEPKPNGNKPDTSGALRLLEDLRIQLESGAIVGLALVAIEPTDITAFYAVATVPITRLRFAGAVAALNHHFLTDHSLVRPA